MYGILSLEFRVWSIEYRVSNITYRTSAFSFRADFHLLRLLFPFEFNKITMLGGGKFAQCLFPLFFVRWNAVPFVVVLHERHPFTHKGLCNDDARLAFQRLCLLY